MHEWALAEGIIQTADKFAEDQGMEEVTEVKIMVGELQQVEHDIIGFALDQLRTKRLSHTEFVFESVPARFKCRKCGHEWQLETEKMDKETGEAIHFVPEMAHVYIKCPACGSTDFEVTQGRGVWLATMRGRKKE